MKVIWITLGLIVLDMAVSSIALIISKNKKNNYFNVIIQAICTCASKVLTGAIAVMVGMSVIVALTKPMPEDVMPAFYYNGSYSEYGGEYFSSEVIEQLLSECNYMLGKSSDPDILFDRAFLYYRTHNYDLAIEDLKACLTTESNWEYLYDLGVVYGYMRDYKSSILYLNEALNYDIPITNRGGAKNALEMMEAYYQNWLFSVWQ